MVIPKDEESVGRSTYENLVRLTFLCGRGLGPEELARRYVAAIRPNIPASGAWLFQGDRIVAADAEPGQRAPRAPGARPVGLAPQVEQGQVTATVLPGMVLVCRLEADGQSVQRASDVVTLAARVIALAWQAELVALDERWDDDYLTAKSAFKRRWLRSLLRRYKGRMSDAARAAGLSRSTLYTMIEDAGLSSEVQTISSGEMPALGGQDPAVRHGD